MVWITDYFLVNVLLNIGNSTTLQKGKGKIIDLVYSWKIYADLLPTAWEIYQYIQNLKWNVYKMIHFLTWKGLYFSVERYLHIYWN